MAVATADWVFETGYTMLNFLEKEGNNYIALLHLF